MAASPPLIIVFEGDKAVRESLKFALELENFTVVTCGTDDGLLSHPALTRACCVVFDARTMREQDTIVLRQLRWRYKEVPIILVVNIYTDAIRAQAAAAGVSAVVEKPFLDTALIDALRGAMCKAL